MACAPAMDMNGPWPLIRTTRTPRERIPLPASPAPRLLEGPCHTGWCQRRHDSAPRGPVLGRSARQEPALATPRDVFHEFERTWVSLPAFAHSDQRTTPWPPAMLGAHQTTPTTARAHAQQEPLTSVRKTQQMPRACTGTGTRVLLPRTPPAFRSELRGGLGSGRGRWRAP